MDLPTCLMMLDTWPKHESVLCIDKLLHTLLHCAVCQNDLQKGRNITPCVCSYLSRSSSLAALWNHWSCNNDALNSPSIESFAYDILLPSGICCTPIPSGILAHCDLLKVRLLKLKIFQWPFQGIDKHIATLHICLTELHFQCYIFPLKVLFAS